MVEPSSKHKPRQAVPPLPRPQSPHQRQPRARLLELRRLHRRRQSRPKQPIQTNPCVSLVAARAPVVPCFPSRRPRFLQRPATRPLLQREQQTRRPRPMSAFKGGTQREKRPAVGILRGPVAARTRKRPVRRGWPRKTRPPTFGRPLLTSDFSK